MTQPLSEETLERLEVKHRNCAETDHRCDAPQLLATIRGLEAENRELREALRSFDEYKGNTCGWCDAEPGPLGKPQKHAPDCELAALLDVPHLPSVRYRIWPR